MKTYLARAAQCAALFLIVLTFAAAMPGGFRVSVNLPNAAVSKKVPNAVLAISPVGCHEPAKARISATAEGLVNGRRESRPLKLEPVSDGLYAVSRQWPSEGTWVIAVTGSYRGRTSSTLVELGSGGSIVTRIEKGRREVPNHSVAGKLSRQDINAALAVAGS